MSEDRLLKIQNLWGLTTTPIFHRNVANDIYFSRIKDLEVAIRISPGSQRTAGEIQAELDFISYLKKNTVNVCETIVSLNKNEIETIFENDQSFQVVVFKKIAGDKIGDHGLTTEIVEAWATEMATMHNLSETYQPGTVRRNHWNLDSTYLKAFTSLSEASKEITIESLKIFNWMLAHSKNKAEYGLIHADLHRGNFFYHQDKMTVFDFDDSCYHWYLYDVAIPILMIVRDYEGVEFQPERDRLVKLFFETYFKIRPAKAGWKEDFIQFYKYRCLFVHLWLIGILKERNPSEEMRKNFHEAIEWEGQHIFSGQIEGLLLQLS